MQAEEQSRWEAQREVEEAKLRRDKRVLEKQSKALLKLPNKKERTAMEGWPQTVLLTGSKMLTAACR